MRIGWENDLQSATKYVFFLALALFFGNAKNNQPLHYVRQRQSTWLLLVVLSKRFGLDNFWRMWDMCKKDRHSACVTIKEA